ncbi:MAG: DUF4173 domain-containing protein [Myxococcota bacterium]|nr:DUF4173 domain-containing protein [Myxococcota bacterium]
MDRVIGTNDAPLTAAEPAGERPLSRLALAVAAAVAAWDFLFYDEIGGFTHGLFTLLSLGLLAWAHPGALALRLPQVLAAGLGGIAVAQFIEPSLLATVLAILGLASFGLVARAERALEGAAWLRSWAEMATRGWLQLARDLGSLRAVLAERGGWRGRLARVLGNWLPPFLLSLPFVGLFAMANPLIELRLEGLGEAIADFFAALHPARLLAWLVVGAAGWALLRFRARPEAPAASPVFTARREALEGRMLVRCLAVFNALFAVQTVLDLGYFWSGFSLPEGMTYATYAHRGAYPLVVTTLLAILFILGAFRDRDRNLETPERRRAVWLVYVWLGQNAFLLASAAARLELYVDVYQLTRLRVAAAIWLGLVAAGLAFTLVKIATRRTNAWLVNANLATTAAVLWLCCFPDFSGFIAEHNVDRALATRGELDVYYLRKLGPAAQPALRRWWDSPQRVATAPMVPCADQRLRRELDEQLRGWRGHSLRRTALRARRDPEWHERLPACERPC